MEMTTFYYPGWRRSIIMDPEESDSSSSDEEMKSAREEEGKDGEPVGFVGTETDDLPYASLMEHHNIFVIFETLDPIPTSNSKNEIEWAVAKNHGPLFECRREDIPIQAKTEIVFNWKYRGKPREQEAEDMDLSGEQIENVLYEFDMIRKASRKVRKSINMRRSKLTKRHIQQIRMFVEQNLGNGFTLADVKQNLLQHYPALDNISLPTLSMILKKKLKLSYKKLGVTNPAKILPEHRSNLVYWCKAIIGLLERGFYLIFTDEFLVNRNTINTYGWTPTGMPGRLLKRPTNFRMSFVVAHSQEQIEGIMGTKTTFNQEKYLKFLKRLVLKTKNMQSINHSKIVIVADNCRFHRTTKVRKYFEREKLVSLFIPPYSPEINPCEKLINWVKMYVKDHVNSQK